ncbi:MAG: hypothetical protein ACE5FG_15670 [Myxococcota bacterium]
MLFPGVSSREAADVHLDMVAYDSAVHCAVFGGLGGARPAGGRCFPGSSPGCCSRSCCVADAAWRGFVARKTP